MEAPGKQNTATGECPSCGGEVPLESKFCLKCGRELVGKKLPAVRLSSKSRLLHILPWILPILLVILVISTQSLFLTKGNSTQNGFAVVIAALGFLAWITGTIAFFVQMIRRKSKRLWANIAFCSFAAMIIGISMGTYVDVSSSDKAGPSANAPTSPSSAKPTSTAATPSGSRVELARQTVPATGGTITINKPGDTLNGLQITVPPGAYKTATNFTVSYQNVKSANPDLTNASPLILVENGGGVSQKPMTMKIPIKYGDDDFPMVFDYDVATGDMEPIPTTGIDGTSITVEVYHFSGKLVLTAKGQYLKSQELLYLKKGFPTKFEPGKDDWAFQNRSSFISPNGNCAGMSVTALWYFMEKSKGQTNRLNGQYPGRLQAIQEDDREAWRLVSTVQQDIDLSADLPGTFDRPAFIGSNWHGDEVTYKSFQMAMIITGQPQLVIMNGKDKQTGKKLDVGHAMVVYGFKDGLLVADPNDPGSRKGEHVIPYKAGKLGPYETDTDPQNSAVGIIYDTFFFGARGGSYLSWERVGAHWNEVARKTIGDGRFPDYTLKVTDDRMGQSDIYQDAVTVDRRSVSIQVDSSNTLGLMLYRDGAWVNRTPQRTITLDLKNDANLLGVFVQGKPSAESGWKWTDFKWVTITYTAPQAPAASPQAPQLEAWGGKLTGTSKTEMSQTSGTWSLVEISFDFTVNVSFTGTSKGTGSVTGSANVGRATLTNDASRHSIYRTATITGGPVTNGASLELTPPSGTGPGSMFLAAKPGQPIKFGSHSRDVYTTSDNPTLPLQCYGISLVIESRTPTSISGTWRFYEPSQYVQASSPTYRFTLTRGQ